MKTTRKTRVALAVGAAVIAALAGCTSSSDKASSKTADADLIATTPKGTKPVDSADWAIYRSVGSLDPVVAFDYPENTVVSLLCESVLRQDPDGHIVPGLTTLTQPDPQTMVLAVRDGATFWDGNPVTAADVLFSLERAADPASGSYYASAFESVASMEASGRAVTISLKAPDAWLAGELASMGGVILEADFTEAQGKAYGTIDGGTMCSGSYKLDSWTSSGLSVVRNDEYWDTEVDPQVKQINFKAVSDANTASSGFLSGELDGYYASTAIPNLDRLDRSNTVDVIQGPAQQTELLAVSNLEGPLGDVEVRQALSLALDRAGIVKAVYGGAANLPRWISNSGTFGYGKSIFDAAYKASPEMTQDVAKAKKLVADAGLAGKSITIATTPVSPGFTTSASAYQAAGKAIGLDVKIKTLSAQTYISLFTDPRAREGIDAFLTVNYGDWADPAALLRTIAVPGGSQNFSGFDDKKLTDLMDTARATTDDDERAKLMAEASTRAAELLPWIPTVQPTNVLILSKKLTGAVSSFSYMFAPWANDLGGK